MPARFPDPDWGSGQPLSAPLPPSRIGDRLPAALRQGFASRDACAVAARSERRSRDASQSSRKAWHPRVKGRWLLFWTGGTHAIGTYTYHAPAYLPRPVMSARFDRSEHKPRNGEQIESWSVRLRDRDPIDTRSSSFGKDSHGPSHGGDHSRSHSIPRVRQITAAPSPYCRTAATTQYQSVHTVARRRP